MIGRIPDEDLAAPRAVSLQQPYASLVSLGGKFVETRGRDLGARPGEVLCVHASIANFPGAPEVAWSILATKASAIRRQGSDADLVFAPPRGAIVAVARVGAVGRVVEAAPEEGRLAVLPLRGDEELLARLVATALAQEVAVGNWSVGRSLTFFSEIERLRRPLPCRGALGLWKVPPLVAAAVRADARERVLVA